MEKPISRQMHGVADYAYAPLMFAAPEISGFTGEDKAVTVSRIVGSGVLAATMLTKAEWGIYKVLPFEEAYEMVEKGIITDSVAVTAILKVKILLLQGKLS